VERYRATQEQLGEFLSWLTRADLESEDLARIRDVLERKRQAEQAPEHADLNTAQAASPDGPANGVRLGSGWLEAKLIPKPGGRLNGPYLYFRARRAGRLRSIYLGKVNGSAR
jgi:hypothetical protein